MTPELKEIKEYWLKKYPDIVVNLWTNEDRSRYFANMITYNDNKNLTSETIGDLISQGDTFLRKASR